MLHLKDAQNSSGAVDAASGIQLLTRQIKAANQILMNRPIQPKEYAAWNAQTKTCLIQIYGEDSPNIETITKASGTEPVWLFMPDDVAEKSEASCLENKIKLLEGCVVALKRKASNKN